MTKEELQKFEKIVRILFSRKVKTDAHRINCKLLTVNLKKFRNKKEVAELLLNALLSHAKTNPACLRDNFVTPDVVWKQPISYGSPAVYAMFYIKNWIDKDHAFKIAEMLLWEEVYKNSDTSLHTLILKTLQQIGDKQILSELINYFKKFKKYRQKDTHYQVCENEILKTMQCCEENSKPNT